MLKRIHVNQHLVRKRKQGEDVRVFTIKTYNKNVRADEVECSGESRLKYYEKPLSCGAHVWLETHETVFYRVGEDWHWI